MTISKIGGVFFTAITTTNNVSRERSEYVGGTNVQTPPSYICFSHEIATAGSQVNMYNMTGQSASFGFASRVTVPATFPLVATVGVNYHPSGELIAFGSTTLATPLVMYQLTGGTSPFGSLRTNPSGLLSAQYYYLRFRNSGNALAIPTNNATTRFLTYNVTGATSSAPLGSKLTDPTFPTNTTRSLGLGWHPNDQYLAVASTSTTQDALSVYPVSGSPLAYGTRISTPSAFFGDCRNAGFSPKGDMVFVTSVAQVGVTDYIKIYPWSGNGMGTAYSLGAINIATHSIFFSSDQKYLAFLPQSSSPYLRIYNWSGTSYNDYGIGTQITLSQTLPAGGSRHGAWFGINDRYIMIGSDVAPRIHVYTWGINQSGNMYSKLSDPATMPSSNSQDVSVPYLTLNNYF